VEMEIILLEMIYQNIEEEHLMELPKIFNILKIWDLMLFGFLLSRKILEMIIMDMHFLIYSKLILILVLLMI